MISHSLLPPIEIEIFSDLQHEIKCREQKKDDYRDDHYRWINSKSLGSLGHGQYTDAYDVRDN